MNIILTGGVGFIGSNTAKYYLDKGDTVVIFDNFSRNGTQKNLSWLNSLKNKPILIKGEITSVNDILKLNKYLIKADLVVHLAAQVAVTTSVIDPRNDFEINAFGTFNILEAMRLSKSKAKFIYTSTNKVYGGMEDIKIVKRSSRYEYRDYPNGIAEDKLLDFHSPYGCSKGAADQYVHDYNRIYGLDTTVVRQSCIYGPRQFGVEDQGWVAWFIIALTKGEKLHIYGDGLQVRDLLFIDDLVECYDLIYKNSKITSGNIYNIGGGKGNTMSVWAEFNPLLEKLFKRKITATFSNWRPGDQLIYVSDIRKAKQDFGWKPKTSVQQGITKLFHWVQTNIDIFE